MAIKVEQEPTANAQPVGEKWGQSPFGYHHLQQEAGRRSLGAEAPDPEALQLELDIAAGLLKGTPVVTALSGPELLTIQLPRVTQVEAISLQLSGGVLKVRLSGPSEAETVLPS